MHFAINSKSNKMKNVLLFGMLLITISSCQYSPYTDEYLTEKPKPEDIIGIYKFDKQTVNYDLDKEKINEFRPTIIVKADKTFEVKEIPYFRNSDLKKYNYKNGISKTGRWTLTTVG